MCAIDKMLAARLGTAGATFLGISSIVDADIAKLGSGSHTVALGDAKCGYELTSNLISLVNTSLGFS